MALQAIIKQASGVTTSYHVVEKLVVCKGQAIATVASYFDADAYAGGLSCLCESSYEITPLMESNDVLHNQVASIIEAYLETIEPFKAA